MRQARWIAVLIALVGAVLVIRASRLQGPVEKIVSGSKETQEAVPTIDPPVSSKLTREEVVPSMEEATADHTLAAEGEAIARAELARAGPTSGVELWFLVADEAGEPLPEASVELRWGADGGASGTPRAEDGLTWIGGVPEGLISVEASCPGFMTRRYETLVPWNPARLEGIMLAPAAALVGEVLREGATPGPVVVYCWRDGYESDAVSVTLGDEEEGRFAFEAVPLGEILVTAVSSLWGQSEIVSAATKPNEVAEVALTLRGDRHVTGVILDRETGLPLRSAEAQLVVSTSTVSIADVATSLVDEQGRFFLPGAAARGSSVVASAPGFASQTRTISSDEVSIDIGSIALRRAQTLTLCLVSDGAFSAADYHVFSDDGRISLSTFGDDGCLRFEQVAAEYLEATIQGPDHSFLHLYLSPQPGQEVRIEVPVKGLGTAHITFNESIAVDGTAVLSVAYDLAPGVRCEHSFLLDRLVPTTVDGLPPGSVTAALFVEDVALGSDTGIVEGTATVDLFIEESRGRYELRVVDAAGLPIEGAEISLTSASQEVGATSQTTDAQGMCSFPQGSTGERFALIRHPSKGVRVSVLLPGVADEILDIVLQPTSSLDVAFRCDDGVPVGVSCVLSDPIVHLVAVHTQDADTAGLLRWDLLHAGRYLLQARHPRFFPLDALIDVAGPTKRELALRMRGGLALIVSDAEGAPLSGLPIALLSIADDVSVEQWAARTWIDLPPQGLVTDALGRLEVVGLASGPYEWHAQGRSGSATVRAGSTTETRIVLE